MEARDAETKNRELQRLSDASRLAAKFGLEVAVGHGLSYRNVLPVLGSQGLTRVTVGYTLAARAIVVGFEHAVREMMELICRPAPLIR